MAIFLAFVAFGVAIYFYASRKSRRDDAVEARVKKMVAARKDYATFNDLYFEAARSYAIAKGALSPERDAASATMLVNGRSYFVVFMKETGGGTTISISDTKTIENELLG